MAQRPGRQIDLRDSDDRASDDRGRDDRTSDDRTSDDRASDDRGREAQHPTQIPRRGWKDVAMRVKASLKDDQVGLLAAGIAFFALLALAPALAAIVSVYGLVASPADVQSQVQSFASALPQEAQTLLTEQMRTVASQQSGLGIGLVVSLLAALWAASGGMQNVVAAINVAYDEPETRGFVKLRGLALLLTVGAIVVVVGALGLITVLPAVLDHTPLGGAGQTIVSVLRWPALLVLMMAGLAVLYRSAPARDKPRLKWASPGAIVATVIWVVASLAFSFYVSNFGNYNKTYGSLGAVVILLLWMYLTAFTVLLGAEINAEMERQTRQDTTTGPSKPLGEREAYAADSVGPTADELKQAKQDAKR